MLALLHVDALLDELVPRVMARQPRALGRAISFLEDGGEGQRELMHRRPVEVVLAAKPRRQNPEISVYMLPPQ